MEGSGSLKSEREAVETKLYENTSLRILLVLNHNVCGKVRADRIFSPMEKLSLVEQATAWVSEYHETNSSCAKRSCPILVSGPNGREVLVTRFLRSQAPPSQFDSLQKCAHFVSLIPFLDGWKAFDDKEFPRIWSSSRQFLNIIAGNWEEHAALLANYFLFLNENLPKQDHFDVYMVFGSSLSEGNVVRVLNKIS